MLEALNLTKRFGGLLALDQLSCSVQRGEILGVIGPNGAGKSTLLNCISGIHKPNAGDIRLNGKSLVGLPPYVIFRAGVGRSFQVPRLFRKSSVLENVIAPALDSGADLGSLKRKALHLLDYVGLQGLEGRLGEELSGGQQKLVEFARLLMFDPTMILLDEPFAGVHPDIKLRMHEKVLDLQSQGKSFVLVSHDMESTYALSTRILVMHNGRKLLEGSRQDVETDERVIEAYLGR